MSTATASLTALGGDVLTSTTGLTVPTSATGGIQEALYAAGVSPDAISNAVQNYTGISAGAQGAILNVVKNGISASTVMPLVSAALAATGVGAPAAALLAIGEPIAAGLLSAIGSTVPNTVWAVGGMNILAPTTRPYAPDAP